MKKLTPFLLAISLSLVAASAFAEPNSNGGPPPVSAQEYQQNFGNDAPSTSNLRPLVLRKTAYQEAGHALVAMKPLTPERSTTEVVIDTLWKDGDGPTRLGVQVGIVGLVLLGLGAFKLFRR